jgi:hypothetical protein
MAYRSQIEQALDELISEEDGTKTPRIESVDNRVGASSDIQDFRVPPWSVSQHHVSLDSSLYELCGIGRSFIDLELERHDPSLPGAD